MRIPWPWINIWNMTTLHLLISFLLFMESTQSFASEVAMEEFLCVSVLVCLGVVSCGSYCPYSCLNLRLISLSNIGLVFYYIQLSSVQGGIYMPGKGHMCPPVLWVVSLALLLKSFQCSHYSPPNPVEPVPNEKADVVAGLLLKRLPPAPKAVEAVVVVPNPKGLLPNSPPLKQRITPVN